MTAKLIKTARGLEIPQVELEHGWTDFLPCSVSASAPHEGLFSLVKPCHMRCQPPRTKSNVIRMEEQDTTKRKKVSILVTGRKNIYKKQTKQTEVSRGASCQPTSRWRPQEDSEKYRARSLWRARAKNWRGKKTGDLLSFSPCTSFKTRSCPHNLNATLSFLILCSETARKRLLRGLGTG